MLSPCVRIQHGIVSDSFLVQRLQNGKYLNTNLKMGFPLVQHTSMVRSPILRVCVCVFCALFFTAHLSISKLICHLRALQFMYVFHIICSVISSAIWNQMQSCYINNDNEANLIFLIDKYDFKRIDFDSIIRRLFLLDKIKNHLFSRTSLCICFSDIFFF